MASLKVCRKVCGALSSALKSALNSPKSLFYLGLGTTLTIVLLSWAFRDVSLVAVWRALQQANWGWLLLGWLAYLVSYAVRAQRCQTLMSATALEHQGRFKTYLAAVFVGFGASCLIPGYAGEVIRAAIPARLDRVPFEAAFGSIFAERILDLGIVFLFLLLPIWGNALPAGALHGVPLGWIGAVIVLAWLLLLGLASLPDLVVHYIGKACSLLKLNRFQAQITASLKHFLDGLTALRRPSSSLVALLETALIWSLNAITYWSALLAFGILAPGFAGALFTQSTTALAVALPTTPGAVGAFEVGIRFSLGLYQIPLDLTLAYAVALRFLMFVTIPIIALVISARLGLSRSELSAQHSLKP